MSIPVSQVKIPTLSQEPRQRWGTRRAEDTQVNQVEFDPEFTQGARNAVNVCLRVQPAEKVCVITDEATIEIASALVQEIQKVGAPYRAWVLEDLAPRPLTDMPAEILEDLETSQVSIFAVQAQTNELRSRIQMTNVVNRKKIRHAHMVNINRQIMLERMRADFQKVDRLSTKVIAMVRKAHTVRARTAAGTDLTADLNPNYKWLKTSGIITPEKWGNLPGGEIFTTPGEVNGVDLEIEIWPTSIVVPKGSRLALSVRGKDYEWQKSTGARLSNFKNELLGCGPFLHNDARDRPVSNFGGTTTLHLGGERAYVLLPVIPPDRH